MRFPIVLGLALGCLAASCATVPRPIPITGSAGDLSQLAGEWNGEYHGLAGGRQGLIVFRLAAGADTAFGEVIMFPQDRGMDRASREARSPTQPPSTPHELRISFVRSAEGMVSGRLDPYTDPECGCQVTTVFEGRVQGDIIEGTYVSHRSGTPEPLRGEWKVRRKKS